MNWIIRTLTSSVGKKVLMSLTGLFLVTFLIVHMVGNFQLLIPDIEEASASFNKYAVFMTTFPLIKATSYLLYGSILFHTLLAIITTWQNKQARPVGYAVDGHSEVNWMSRYMGVFGTVIFVFLIVHMGNFWFRYHFGDVLPIMEIDGEIYKNLYAVVATSFMVWWYSLFYIVAMFAVGFHLWHGFQSGFQTLGLRHIKYTSIVSITSKLLAIAFIVGFASMPIYMMARFGVENDFETAADRVRDMSEEAGIEWKTAEWSDIERHRTWQEVEADEPVE